jgi:hypothetical protein
MRRDLDDLIRKKEGELQPFLLRMEALRRQFVDDVTKFVAQWYEDKAKEYATKKPEITLNLGKEQLVHMKTKVGDLAKDSGKIVTAALSDPSFWWHQTPHVNAPPSAYEQLGNDQVGNKFPEVLDKPIRRALGELGSVLEQFGYGVTTGAMKSSYPEFWFECPEGDETDMRPFFPHLFEWSEAMQETIAKYDVEYKKAIAVFDEITSLEEEKKKQEAKALWDSV